MFATMNQYLNTLSQREWWLSCIAAVCFVGGALFLWFIEPLYLVNQQAEKQLAAQKAQTKQLLSEKTQLSDILAEAYIPLQKEGQELTQQISQISKLQDSNWQFDRWLSLILQPMPELQVVSIQSMPAKKSSNDIQSQHALIYELKLTGTLTSLIEFIGQLQKQPNLLTFHKLNYIATQNGQANMHLSLSLLDTQALIDYLSRGQKDGKNKIR